MLRVYCVEGIFINFFIVIFLSDLIIEFFLNELVVGEGVRVGVQLGEFEKRDIIFIEGRSTDEV